MSPAVRQDGLPRYEALGLDGVYRVSRESPEGQSVAVRGEWLAEKEFGFAYKDFTVANMRTGQAVFKGDELSLKL